MASKMLFTMLSKSQNLGFRKIRDAEPLLVRACHTGTEAAAGSRRSDLFSRISPLGDPHHSMVPVLDQWVREGREVKNVELQRIIRNLRARRRYTQALEVSEWMSSKGLCSFSLGDHAVQLDLIGKVRGLESAESYFNSMINQDNTENIYGALLNCYVREGLVEKSLSHMQKMKDMGFTASPLNYNNIMCLYTQAGQLEKVPDVLSEMKESGVCPNNFSYQICINSYGARSDLNSMEKVLREMESQPHISMDWTTYSMVANIYIKEGVNEKAHFYLKKCEEKVYKDALGYNHLISLYASLGNKDEMMRLWGLQKIMCKKQINRDYITMLGSLVKLGELEETGKLLEEWNSSCQNYDFRVPNVLLIGYSQRGLVEKAEAILQAIIQKQKTPTPNSWAILAAGYIEKHNMEKGFECFKEALAVQANNKGWRPKPNLIFKILSWLGDNGDPEEIEPFVMNLLKTKVQINSEIYDTLVKAYSRCGKEVDWLLKSLKADAVDVDDETKKILM